MNIEPKLEQLVQRYEEITIQLSDSSIYDDSKHYAEISKEHSDLSEIVDEYKKFKKIKQSISDNLELMEMDPELGKMARAENAELEDEIEKIEESLKMKLVPQDPEDSKNAVIEIRAGTGGDEAAIFAGDLYEMYSRYADSLGWKLELISLSESEKGGFKEIVFDLSGKDVFAKMKYESGVHRVQRVPETESQGRVHTSAATVAVLPEADEVDIQINPADIEVDTFRASGAGGQHVNKTDSAIRLRHLPSGVVVECQEERSQHKNRDKAMKMLRTRLYEAEYKKKAKVRAEERKSQISSGDRSAKIRTYNFPQGRFTDHRIGLTLYNLDDIMKGNLEEVVQALRVQDNLDKLKSMAE